MWTFPILFLVFALGCFAAAITAGDLGWFGAGIPKLSNRQRVLAAIAGAICLVPAIYFLQASAPAPSSPPPRPAAAAALDPVIIGDRLGNRQTYERLSIELDGARAGEIVLTATRRTGRIAVPATNRTASYVLYGEEVTSPAGGGSIHLRLVGDGTIQLLAGGRYCVKATRRRVTDGPDVGRRVLAPGGQCLP